MIDKSSTLIKSSNCQNKFMGFTLKWLDILDKRGFHIYIIVG